MIPRNARCQKYQPFVLTIYVSPVSNLDALFSCMRAAALKGDANLDIIKVSSSNNI